MSNDSRVPAGVPTGGQFAASARGESTVNLAGTPEPASDTKQAVLDAMRDYLADRTSTTRIEDRMRTAIPGLAATGAVDDIGFKHQMLYPLMSAVAKDDTDTVDDLTERIAALEAADQAYLDSGWTPPNVDITDRDNMYGARHTGSRYEDNMPLTEVTKAMRADIKDAQAAGYLPADLTYRVTKDGNAVRITVEGMPDERALWRNTDSEYKSPGARFHTQPSWEALRLRTRLDGIGGAYAYSQSSGMHDYSNVSHHVSTTVESETEALWRAHEKEKAGLLRKVKAAGGNIDLQRLLAPEAEEMQTRHAAELRAKREADRAKWDW